MPSANVGTAVDDRALISHPPGMIAGDIAYVALAVTDVEAMARVLARDFGLARSDCRVGDTSRTAPVFAVGRSALAVFHAADPFLGGDARPGVHHLALAAADVTAAAGAAVHAGLAVAAGDPGAGLAARRRVLLSSDSTAGVRTYLSEPLDVDVMAQGWVQRIDHVGVASADNDAGIDAFSTRMGFGIESRQTDVELSIAVESFTSDRYGVVSHTRAPEVVGGLRVAFVTVGECELELLQDLDPREGTRAARGPGTTRGDRSAIARFVASRGSGLHHLALKVDDVDRALASLAAAGLTVIDRVGRPGSRRARIGFIHPSSLGGVLMHLVEREV